MKNIFKTTALLLSLGTLAVSCDLSEYNPNAPGYQQVFGNAENVQYVLNGFYGVFPRVTNAYTSGKKSDVFITDRLEERFTAGYISTSKTTWGEWENIYNANYAIQQLSSSAADNLSTADRNNFMGQFRFFRAYTYFIMLKQYGDLPWYDKVVTPDNSAYEHKERDSRDEVVKNIIADLDYAISHITATSKDATGLTADVARFVKMDLCLYEASFRKYNNVTKSVTGKAFSNYTVESLYALCAETAKEIMDGGKYGLVDNYRDLFLSDNLQTKEVILGAQTGATSDTKGSQNNYFLYKADNGEPKSLTRAFVNTYLKADGTPYTDNAGYATQNWKDEFAGRDPRLALSVWHPGYQYDEVQAVPDFDVAPLGYEMRKFCYDYSTESQTVPNDEGRKNTNSTPIFRYAAVLLSYAEAKAELGQLTADDWAKTIGAIRKRAGITGSTLTALPTKADAYLQKTFYPNVSDAVLLEIRRERSIELIMEASRQADLIRWGVGNNLADAPWDGIIIDALDTPLDLDGNGTKDVCFYTTENPGNEEGVKYYPILSGDKVGLHAEAVGSKYQLYFVLGTADRYWSSDNKMILDAIPNQVVEAYKAAGYVITQNPGW